MIDKNDDITNNKDVEVTNNSDLNENSVETESTDKIFSENDDTIMNNIDSDLDDTTNDETVEKVKKKSWKRELLEWIITLCAAVLIALVIRTFIFEPVKVDGKSMNETLQNGEVMFVTKPEYIFGNPERFDIVICHYPDRKVNFVKRVVGLPGDIVEINNGFLIVNGETYPEEYITHRPDYKMEPYTVPENMYFVLGDNRSNSNDSHIIGPITRDMIKGHVKQVVYPFSEWRSLGLDDSEIEPMQSSIN